MCTYDYTPYVGCPETQQHYFLQWMKCNKALESGNKYCRMDKSTEVQGLKRLSGNVLTCPIHNPISVQQPELILLRRERQEANTHERRSDETETSRLRTRHRKENTPVRCDEAAVAYLEDRSREAERHPRKAKRDPSPASSLDSGSSDIATERVGRQETSSETKRLDYNEPTKKHRAASRSRSRRRTDSAVDMRQPPTPPIPPIHNKSNISLPGLKTEKPKTMTEGPQLEGKPINPIIDNRNVPTRPPRPARPPMSISVGELLLLTNTSLGLPSSPDIHRRMSMMSLSAATATKSMEHLPIADHPPSATATTLIGGSANTFLHFASDLPVAQSPPSQKKLAIASGKDEVVTMEPIEEVMSVAEKETVGAFVTTKQHKKTSSIDRICSPRPRSSGIFSLGSSSITSRRRSEAALPKPSPALLQVPAYDSKRKELMLDLSPASAISTSSIASPQSAFSPASAASPNSTATSPLEQLSASLYHPQIRHSTQLQVDDDEEHGAVIKVAEEPKWNAATGNDTKASAAINTVSVTLSPGNGQQENNGQEQYDNEYMHGALRSESKDSGYSSIQMRKNQEQQEQQPYHRLSSKKSQNTQQKGHRPPLLDLSASAMPLSYDPGPPPLATYNDHFAADNEPDAPSATAAATDVFGAGTRGGGDPTHGGKAADNRQEGNQAQDQWAVGAMRADR